MHELKDIGALADRALLLGIESRDPSKVIRKEAIVLGNRLGIVRRRVRLEAEGRGISPALRGRVLPALRGHGRPEPRGERSLVAVRADENIHAVLTSRSEGARQLLRNHPTIDDHALLGQLVCRILGRERTQGSQIGRAELRGRLHGLCFSRFS